ncbi:MAG: ABC transporter permease [Planctomycetaceae bacterium]|nr:ABC transporter permease [Planctomycetaceae bacterium]
MNGITKVFSRQNAALYTTLVLVFLLMTVLNGEKFFGVGNLFSMAYQLPVIGLLSVGMMVAMLTGGINLSIIANTNLNGIIIYMVLGAVVGAENIQNAGIAPVALAILAGFLASCIVGFINGFLISYFDIPAILVTLGTMTLVNGLNIVLTKGYTITGFPSTLNFLGAGSVLGIPASIILFVAAVLVISVILNRTRFGFSLYMMGANPVAAEYSSVDIQKTTIMQYVLSACFASLTSLVMIGQFNSVKSSYAASYLLVAVLASFLGGVDPNGGFGKVGGVVAAAVVLQFISSGLNLLRMDPFMITAMWGGIIILIIFARAIAGRLKSRMQSTR